MFENMFEAIMLICFGIAWPFSIYRSLKSRSVEGKSIWFLIVVLVGYIAGIINKIITGTDIVLYLYVLNLLMVAVDTMLFIRNKRYANAGAA